MCWHKFFGDNSFEGHKNLLLEVRLRNRRQGSGDIFEIGSFLFVGGQIFLKKKNHREKDKTHTKKYSKMRNIFPKERRDCKKYTVRHTVYYIEKDLQVKKNLSRVDPRCEKSQYKAKSVENQKSDNNILNPLF